METDTSQPILRDYVTVGAEIGARRLGMSRSAADIAGHDATADTAPCKNGHMQDCARIP